MTSFNLAVFCSLAVAMIGTGSSTAQARDIFERIGNGRKGLILFHTPAPQTSTLPMLDHTPRGSSSSKPSSSPSIWITPNGDVFRQGQYTPESLGRAQVRQIGNNIYWVYGNQKLFIETVTQAQQRQFQQQQQQQRMQQQQMFQQNLQRQQQLNQQYYDSVQQSVNNINNAIQQMHAQPQYLR